ncbi:MAG: O-antigen ligase family protein [Candidatus Erginobacter occultus]|nr:O-antigen ligase family protein [Candidatus Erginobacter occultus]
MTIAQTRIDSPERMPDGRDRPEEGSRSRDWRGKYRALLGIFLLLVIIFVGVGQVSLNRNDISLEQPLFRFSLPSLPGISFSVGGKLENLVLPLLVLWILGVAWDRSLRPRKTPFFPPLLIFLGFAVLAYIFSPFRSASWSNGLRELLLGGGFFLAAGAILSSPTRQRTALSVLYISVGVSALAGLYLFSCRIYFPDTPQRIWLSFMHPNTTGSVLLLLIPLGISLAIGKNHIRLRILTGVVTVFLSLAMVLTFSRTAWLGLLLALGVLVMHCRLRFYLLGGFALMAAILVLGINFGPQSYLQNRVKSISAFTSDPNILKRLVYWSSASRMIQNRPLLGYGPGARVFQAAYEKDFNLVETGEAPVHAHSMYLALGIGVGIPGLLAFFWLIAVSFNMLRSAAARGSSAFRRFYGRGLTAGLAGFLIGGLADNPFFSFRVMLVFWLLLAVATAGKTRLFDLVKATEVG